MVRVAKLKDWEVAGLLCTMSDREAAGLLWAMSLSHGDFSHHCVLLFRNFSALLIPILPAKQFVNGSQHQDHQTHSVWEANTSRLFQVVFTPGKRGWFQVSEALCRKWSYNRSCQWPYDSAVTGRKGCLLRTWPELGTSKNYYVVLFLLFAYMFSFSTLCFLA